MESPKCICRRVAVRLGGVALTFTSFGLLHLADAQAALPWQLRAEIGKYDIHVSTPDGLALAAHAGRRIVSHLLWDIGLTFGVGDDNFMALEPGIELQLFPTKRLNPFVAAGVGLMLERGESLSGPRYIAGGLEVRVWHNNYVRATVRRSNHISFGDAGTFRGPHLLSIGWVFRL